jgi:nitrite reductase/ring-hydroxylating ferredoxin subunit
MSDPGRETMNAMSQWRIPDTWWALALSEEVSRDIPLARACAGQPYVLFRDAGGAPRALEDRCAHRRVPLSLGKLLPDGTLQCGYHGWTFEGKAGRCTAIAVLGTAERIPAIYGVAPFRTIERDGFVYVWSGGAKHADPPAPACPAIDGQTMTGGHALTLPHNAFVETLLDAPHLLLDFEGLYLETEMLGDPRIIASDVVESRFGAHWQPVEHRARVSPDAPLVLSVSARRDTGQSTLSLSDIDGAALFFCAVACEPAAKGVTRLRWRATSRLHTSGGEPAAFTIRKAVAAEGLLALRANMAGTLWQQKSDLQDAAQTTPTDSRQGMA